MGSVDHDPLRFSGLACQLGEDAVENTQAAPADEPVLDRLVRAVSLGCISPHQPMLDDVDNPRDNPPIIDSRYPMRQREKWLDPAHLRLTQQKRNIHRQRFLDATIESTLHASCKQFNRS
jgi:hypothetical protein